MIGILFRSFALLGVVIGFMSQSSLITLFIWNKVKRKKIQALLIGFYSKISLWACNFEVSVFGEELLSNQQAQLACSNHLSYIDVMVITSVMPSCFITSVEVQKTPVLGQICDLGGCLFFERRNPFKLKAELETVGKLSQQGVRLCFFPEATSSNGQSLLPFKPALFDVAYQSKIPLLLLTIRYTHANGQVIDSRLADSICYYGDVSFSEHILRFIRLKSVRVELHFTKVLDPAHFSDRKEMALASRQIILEKYGNPINATQN